MWHRSRDAEIAGQPDWACLEAQGRIQLLALWDPAPISPWVSFHPCSPPSSFLGPPRGPQAGTQPCVAYKPPHPHVLLPASILLELESPWTSRVPAPRCRLKAPSHIHSVNTPSACRAPGPMLGRGDLKLTEMVPLLSDKWITDALPRKRHTYKFGGSF